MASKAAGKAMGSVWYQKEVALSGYKRGCHLVTDEVLRQVPEIRNIAIGLCHVMIKHTSASLSINENADPSVRHDMEMMLNRMVPENTPFTHDDEGPDDMPAHVKTTLVGSSVTFPITNGRPNLGTWQGIWLCEHRNHSRHRKVVVTIQGAEK